MPFIGDISRIGGIARALEQLAGVPSRAAAPIAERITGLIHGQFVGGRDPYGRMWRGLRPATIAKGRSNPPLDDTGDSKSGTYATPAQSVGIRIFLPTRLVHHQFGYTNARTGRKVGPRAVLPNRGLPATWRKVIDEEVRRAFAESARVA